jgi:ATP-binding cassette subfamily B (MDR/TAP) protein 10
MMLVVPPVAGFAILYGRYVKSLSRQTQTALSEITKVAEERIGNIRTVQAFAKEPKEAERYSMRVQDVWQSERPLLAVCSLVVQVYRVT